MVQSNKQLVLENVRLPGSSSRCSIHCTGSRIEAVGPVPFPEIRDAVVIECAGQLVLPAFVDVHSHADGRVWEPELSGPKVGQGIALEIVGNCGLGPAPMEKTDPGWRSILAGVVAGCPSDWRFSRFGEYTRLLRERNAGRWPQVSSLLPYGAVRAAVAGLRRELANAELMQVRRKIEEGLEDGALGVSLGLVYPPNDAASFDELQVTLRPLARTRRILTAHIRSQANSWIEAIDEVLRLAKMLQVRLLISHLCIGGARNQWKLEWVLARLREARREGVDVWFDQHPYIAGSTSLTQLLPPWAIKSGPRGVELTVPREELQSFISSPSARAGWENYLELIGPDHVLVAGAAGDPELAGRTVAELRAESDRHFGDTLVRLLERTGGNATIVLLQLYQEEAVERIAAEPFGCFATDGVHSSMPHPRLYGTYPYAFRRFVGAGLMTEREFVLRSATRPAQIMNLEYTGLIAPGEEANLIVVDANRFDHRPVYTEPWTPVVGISHLILGGLPQPDVGPR
jgi:N-acyl-D-amino-acid deacylase